MNLDRLQRKRRSFQRGPLAAKRARVAEDLSTVLEAHTQETAPPLNVPVSEVAEGVESYVSMMTGGLERLPFLSPERSELQRIGECGEIQARPPLPEDHGTQTPTSPSRGADKEVFLSDEEDVQELSAETARKQSAFGGGPRFDVPESSSANG